MSALIVASTQAFAADPPKDPGAELQQLTPKPLGERVPVAIFQFRSEVQEVSAGGATDMFVTALVRSSQFRVVDRSRINEGVVAEKKMNAAGMTTGTVAQQQLRGAQYIFEGAVTEANAGESQKQGGINIGGLQLGGGKSKDSVAVDVRVLDADTGDVLDAVTVSLPIKSSNTAISGTAALAGTVASLSGRNANPFTPDVNTQTSAREGVDKTVRTAIESAVLQIIKRIDPKAVPGKNS
jgi:curli biogenesis system outer membrane secretion channel CsgG